MELAHHFQHLLMMEHVMLASVIFALSVRLVLPVVIPLMLVPKVIMPSHLGSHHVNPALKVSNAVIKSTSQNVQ